MESSERPLGRGTPQFCDECGAAYEEISRLPGTVGLCPTCFEEQMQSSK